MAVTSREAGDGAQYPKLMLTKGVHTTILTKQNKTNHKTKTKKMFTLSHS